MPETRDEHLEWCKKRALEYVDRGDFPGAWSSFASNMSKHKETADHIGLQLGSQLFFAGHLSTEEKMRKYIEGFN